MSGNARRAALYHLIDCMSLFLNIFFYLCIVAPRKGDGTVRYHEISNHNIISNDTF